MVLNVERLVWLGRDAGQCVNKRKDCDILAAQSGYCVFYQKDMEELCPAACEICGKNLTQYCPIECILIVT